MTAVLTAFLCLSAGAQNLTGTYMYAQRDTCDLYLDVYDPVPDAELTHKSITKPTLLFVHGGGFVGGYRSSERYFPWFKTLNENGYKVITIDYRFGLKGVKMDFGPIGQIKTALNTIKAEYMGVEDLFSAVEYIIANQDALGIDPENIVLAGNSSGAIVSLAAELSICNQDPYAAVLPEGFNFKGLISFAGAIVGKHGTPKYKRAPCPTLLMHGTADNTVQYRKTQVLNLGLWGTDVLAALYKKNGYPYCVYRYHEHQHDIADNYFALWPVQKEFLEKNIMEGWLRIVDVYVDDPSVPRWEAATLDSLY